MERSLKREQREENILLSLRKLDYLSRSQLQTLHGLGSDRNARKVLQSMEEYLSSFRDGEKIYYLNKAGRERVQCRKLRKKTTQVRHYIMRNDLYIAFGNPFSWKNEVKFGIEDVAFVIADAVFERDGIYHAVEVDHTQKMSKNRTKIEKYRKLSKVTSFKLIWITTTDYRRKQLLKMCEGLDVTVFTAADFH
ncbi:replication-relaxation family protein [Bacillus badius]|nr:replication-relaxation family protein [Bacillus badius]MED0666931.1 replication-relaxation family protein [Bacillus badius]MED4718720.1 replication-relaxation family protein [Bacillus badius]